MAPRLVSAGSATWSLRSPAVRTKTTGLPWPSARTWILVLTPPRERPSASVAGSPLCPGCVLMGTDDGAIDEMEVPVHLTGLVRLLLQGGQDAVPDAGRAPAIEAAGDGLVVAV